MSRVTYDMTGWRVLLSMVNVWFGVQSVTSTCAVGVNPITRLIQVQQAKKEKEPVFSLMSENGVARSKEFVFQVHHYF